MRFPIISLAVLATAYASADVPITPQLASDLNSIVYFKEKEAPLRSQFKSSANYLHILNTNTLGPPKAYTAAVHARTLVRRESIAQVNTVFQDGSLQGEPFSTSEYYADCGDGQPVFIAMDKSTTFKNYGKGSRVSLAIKVGDHAYYETVDDRYPGSRLSMYSSPSIQLFGKFVELTGQDAVDASQCFSHRHEDAAWWTPGNPINPSKWLKFVIDEVAYSGGLADATYQGRIDQEIYLKAGTLDDDSMIGRDASCAYWDKQIQEYQQQFGDDSTMALFSNTVLSRLRRLSGLYQKFVDLEQDELPQDVSVSIDDELHVGDLYDTVTEPLKKNDIVLTTSIERGFNIYELSPELLSEILQNIQDRISIISKYADDYLTSHKSADIPSVNTQESAHEEQADSAEADFAQVDLAEIDTIPVDRFHAKELREHDGAKE